MAGNGPLHGSPAPGGEADEEGSAVARKGTALGQTLAHQAVHDPGDVAGRDQERPGQLAGGHPFRAPVELGHDVEPRQGEVLGDAPSHLPQQQAVHPEEPDPDRDGHRAHTRAVASISTLASSSRRAFTSTSTMAG